ncbi:MAG: hypothetical protein KatS3mg087_1050 [Patescibacteria group bacterium]|nr:MAG: hypothetical protein KatS3mg087_1050 [Patescibacteria group bacterium]
MGIFGNDSEDTEKREAPGLLSDIATITTSPFALFGAGEFDLNIEAKKDPSWRFIADTISETYRKAIESPEEAKKDPELLGPYRGFTAALKEYAPFIGVERLPIAASAALVRLRNDPEYRREAAEGKNRAAELIGLYLADQELRAKEGFFKQVGRTVAGSLQIGSEIGLTSLAGALTGVGGAAGAGGIATKTVAKEAAEELLEQAAKRSLKSILKRGISTVGRYTVENLPKSIPSVARLSEQRLAREFAPTLEETESGKATLKQRGGEAYTAPKAVLYGFGELIPEFMGEGLINIASKSASYAVKGIGKVVPTQARKAASILTSRFAGSKLLNNRIVDFFTKQSARTSEFLGQNLSRIQWKKLMKSLGITATDDSGLMFLAKSTFGEWLEERATDVLHGITEQDFGFFELLVTGQFGKLAHEQAVELTALGAFPVAGAAVSRGIVTAGDVAKIYGGIGNTPTSYFSDDLSKSLSADVRTENALRQHNIRGLVDAAIEHSVSASEEDLKTLDIETPSRNEWENSLAKKIFDAAGIRVYSKQDRKAANSIARILVSMSRALNDSNQVENTLMPGVSEVVSAQGYVSEKDFASLEMDKKAAEALNAALADLNALRQLIKKYEKPSTTEKLEPLPETIPTYEQLEAKFEEVMSQYNIEGLIKAFKRHNAQFAALMSAQEQSDPRLALSLEARQLAETLGFIYKLQDFIMSLTNLSQSTKDQKLYTNMLSFLKNIALAMDFSIGNHLVGAEDTITHEGNKQFYKTLKNAVSGSNVSTFSRMLMDSINDLAPNSTAKERALAFHYLASFASSRISANLGRMSDINLITNAIQRELEKQPRDTNKLNSLYGLLFNRISSMLAGGYIMNPMFYIYSALLPAKGIVFDVQSGRVIVNANEIGSRDAELETPEAVFKNIVENALRRVRFEIAGKGGMDRIPNMLPAIIDKKPAQELADIAGNYFKILYQQAANQARAQLGAEYGSPYVSYLADRLKILRSGQQVVPPQQAQAVVSPEAPPLPAVEDPTAWETPLPAVEDPTAPEAPVVPEAPVAPPATPEVPAGPTEGPVLPPVAPPSPESPATPEGPPEAPEQPREEPPPPTTETPETPEEPAKEEGTVPTKEEVKIEEQEEKEKQEPPKGPPPEGVDVIDDNSFTDDDILATEIPESWKKLSRPHLVEETEEEEEEEDEEDFYGGESDIIVDYTLAPQGPRKPEKEQVETVEAVYGGLSAILPTPAGYHEQKWAVISHVMLNLTKTGREAHAKAGSVDTAIALSTWYSEIVRPIQITTSAKNKIFETYRELDRFVSAMEGQITADTINILGGREDFAKFVQAYENLGLFKLHEIFWQYGALIYPYIGIVDENLAKYLNETMAIGPKPVGREESRPTAQPGQHILEVFKPEGEMAHNQIVYKVEVHDPNYADLWDKLYTSDNVVFIENEMRNLNIYHSERYSFPHLDRKYLGWISTYEEQKKLLESLKERDPDTGKLKSFYVVGNQFPSFVRYFLIGRYLYEQKVKAKQEGREFISRTKVGRAQLGTPAGIGGFIVSDVTTTEDLERYYWPGRSLGVRIDVESYTQQDVGEGGQTTIGRKEIIPARYQYRGKEIIVNRGPVGKVIDLDAFPIFDVPQINDTLIDLQKHGAAIMLDALDKNTAASLQDGTGTGKTHQLLTIAMEYVRNKKSAVLIIIPNSVLESTYYNFSKKKLARKTEDILSGVYREAGDMIGATQHMEVVPDLAEILIQVKRALRAHAARDPYDALMRVYAFSYSKPNTPMEEVNWLANIVFGDISGEIADGMSAQTMFDPHKLYAYWKQYREEIEPLDIYKFFVDRNRDIENTRYDLEREMFEYAEKAFNRTRIETERVGTMTLDDIYRILAKIFARYPFFTINSAHFIGEYLRYYNIVKTMGQVNDVLLKQLQSTLVRYTKTVNDQLIKDFHFLKPMLEEAVQREKYEQLTIDDARKIYLISYNRVHSSDRFESIINKTEYISKIWSDFKSHVDDVYEAFGIALHQALAAASEGNALLALDESQYMKNITTAKRSKLLNSAINWSYGKMHVLFVTATPIDTISHMKYMSYLLSRETNNIMKYLSPWLGVMTASAESEDPKRMQFIVPHVSDTRNIVDLYDQFTALLDVWGRKGIVLSRMLSLLGIEVGWRALQTTTIMDQRLHDLDDILERLGYDYRTRMMLVQHYAEQYKVQDAVDIALRELAEGRKVLIYAAHTGGSSLVYTVAENALAQIRITPEGRLEIVRFAEINRYDYEDDELDAIDRARDVLRKMELLSAEELGVFLVDATQELIMRRLSQATLPNGEPVGKIEVLVGTTPVKRRSEVIKDFRDNDEGTQVLISNVNVGGEGISLDDRTGKRPRTMIIITPPMVATKAVQTVGRIHRLLTVIQAEKPTKVYFVYYPNMWIDVALVQILIRKMRLLGAVTPGHTDRLLHPGLQSMDAATVIRNRNFYTSPVEGNVVSSSSFPLPVKSAETTEVAYRLGLFNIPFEHLGPNMPLAVIPSHIVKQGSVSALDTYPSSMGTTDELNRQGKSNETSEVLNVISNASLEDFGDASIDAFTSTPIITREGVVMANNIETIAFYNQALAAKEEGRLVEYLSQYYNKVSEYLPFMLPERTAYNMIQAMRESLNPTSSMYEKVFFVLAKVINIDYRAPLVSAIGEQFGKRGSNPIKLEIARNAMNHERFGELVDIVAKETGQLNDYASSTITSVSRHMHSERIAKVFATMIDDLLKNEEDRSKIYTKIQDTVKLTTAGQYMLYSAIGGYAYKNFSRNAKMVIPGAQRVGIILYALAPRLARIRKIIETNLSQLETEQFKTLQNIYPGESILNAIYYAQHSYVTNGLSINGAITALKNNYPGITPFEYSMATAALSYIDSYNWSDLFNGIKSLIDKIFTQEILEKGAPAEYAVHANNVAFEHLTNMLPKECE